MINAGVFLKPDDRLLEAAEWPEEIRENSAGLGLCEYRKVMDGKVLMLTLQCSLLES